MLLRCILLREVVNHDVVISVVLMLMLMLLLYCRDGCG